MTQKGSRKKIGLFGGTFNPPHIGHIRAAQCFARETGIDLLYIMPAGIPPHKNVPGSDHPAKRFHMARLAFRDPGCDTVFSAMEISRSGKSYTIDTVNALIEEHGCEKIYLYIGSDMLFYFEKWKDFELLFQKCIIVTAPRCGEDEKNIRECCEYYREKYGCDYKILSLPFMEISSTELREVLRRSETQKCAAESKKYLTEELYGYIMKSDLYREDVPFSDITEKETLESIREDLSVYIDEKRLSHTLSVEKTALEMGEVFLPLYGYGAEYLRDLSAAALLHDITKCKTASWHEEYLLQFMSISGNNRCPAVYHSWSGAYFALENYFVNTRVFRAVYSHTTGRAGMDIFEKIIFLADYIEPQREHISCKKLREEYLKLVSDCRGNAERLKHGLDELILISLENTYEHIKQRGGNVCPALFETMDYIKKGEA